MTTNKQQLREQAESVMHWSSSLTAAWPSDPDFNDVWAVGAIDEDGNRYPVIEVDAADQYDSPGDSEGIAQFFSAASPESVLRLLDEIEALQAECEKLRKDSERIEWLEDQTKKSWTGISFDYHRYVEDGYVVDHGYRFMRRHFVSGFKDSLRKAIDAAMELPQ